MKCLRRVDLSRNQLEGICGLESSLGLSQLLLDFNKIKTLEGVFHLAQLELLSISTSPPRQRITSSRLSLTKSAN